MPSLEQHQLRVAAVAKMVAGSYSEKVDERALILACLFHDMGNIIKSDLPHFPEFIEEKGLAYWEAVKKDFLEKYGPNEHEAAKTIAHEIGLPKSSIVIIDGISFANIPNMLREGPLELQMAEYSDMRVGPHGIVSAKERVRDLQVRYSSQWEKGLHREFRENFDSGAAGLIEIEKQLFASLSIQPEEITDTAIAPIIEDLKTYSV